MFCRCALNLVLFAACTLPLLWVCTEDHVAQVVSFPDLFRKNQEGVWQHVLHRRVRTHCTVSANQVAEFSYVMLI